MQSGKFITLPKETKAFICANCGAVSLSADGICKVQGQTTKADWCGTTSPFPISLCHNRKNNIRYKCLKCGRVAINPELLCEPEQLPIPD
jgi:predicted RNA-binding Zn-ribbon protein involved in translation (DUF1610 family)